MLENTIFTIGHSTHTVIDFIKLLNQNSVSLVCDVRSQPYSKYSRQFNKDSIKKALLENGIGYSFLGEELGGRSKNTSYYNGKGQLQYHLLAQDSLFKQGLKYIMVEVKKHNVALMCSEADPLKCHRTILICKQLQMSQDNNIQHILFDGSLQSNREIEKNLLDKFRIVPDMFRNEEECIAEAYIRQAKKIAYTHREDSVLMEEAERGVSPFYRESI